MPRRERARGHKTAQKTTPEYSILTDWLTRGRTEKQAGVSSNPQLEMNEWHLVGGGRVDGNEPKDIGPEGDKITSLSSIFGSYLCGKSIKCNQSVIVIDWQQQSTGVQILFGRWPSSGIVLCCIYGRIMMALNIDHQETPWIALILIKILGNRNWPMIRKR